MFWHDMPALDSASNVADFAVACDPLPSAGEPGSLYRTSSDRTRGARPGKLRGLFTAAALADGHLAFVDIEDLDAACRRPSTVNTSSTEDAAGCHGDPNIGAYSDGTAPTVSDESSCRVVEEHAERSLQFVISSPDTGVRAPSLRSFPRLSDSDGSLSIGQIGDAPQHPIVLAVGYPGHAPVVQVGTFRYGEGSDYDRPLELDPAVAEEATLLLPQREPRAYPASEKLSLSFEGSLMPERNTGVLADGVLTDSDAGFCGLGVQDVSLARQWGQQLEVAAARLDAFADSHADYVQLTDDFDEKSPYWTEGDGAACEDAQGFDGCKSLFGTAKDPTSARDWTIQEASTDSLVLSPRGVSDASTRRRLLDSVRCCFPGPLKYTVRGANQWVFFGSTQRMPHRVTADAQGRCVLDCSGRTRWNQGRVLEISSSGCADGQTCRIGAAGPTDYACVTTKAAGALDPSATDLAPGCIFDGATARFVVYRGMSPSYRDMQFQWEIIGGFQPLRLSTQSSNSGSSVLPSQVAYLPSNDRLVVVDSALGGVGLFSLVTMMADPADPFL